jgi:hypothetical protein
MPVPPIYIRVTQSTDKRQMLRQVVDGQQRISAVLDFVEGTYRLSRTLKAPWGGKTFEELSAAEQDRIRTYSLAVEVFHGISDPDVLGIFARLNTYSVPLNAQELRNGKYFGAFKESVYSLALEHLEFWRRHGIFSERRIARMLEAELVSELLIAQIDGMQDKKNTIDDFYTRLDEEFKDGAKQQKRFRSVIDELNDVFPDTLSGNEFRRSPLFYTLFCSAFHHVYGLPKEKTKSPAQALSKSDRLALRQAASRLSEVLSQARAKETVHPRYNEFVNACLRQTDNIGPRQTRFQVLYRQAFR